MTEQHKDDLLCIVHDLEFDVTLIALSPAPTDTCFTLDTSKFGFLPEGNWSIYDVYVLTVDEWVYHDPIEYGKKKMEQAYGTLYHDAFHNQIAYTDFLEWQTAFVEPNHQIAYAYRDGREWEQLKQELKERKRNAHVRTSPRKA